GGARGARPLLLRRLLQRQGLELRALARRGDRRAPGAVPGSVALVLWRGRARRALRDVPERHDLQAHGLALSALSRCLAPRQGRTGPACAEPAPGCAVPCPNEPG